MSIFNILRAFIKFEKNTLFLDENFGNHNGLIYYICKNSILQQKNGILGLRRLRQYKYPKNPHLLNINNLIEICI